MRRTAGALVGVIIWAVACVAGAATAAADDHPVGEPLACRQEITRTDVNGTFHLRFQCLPDQGLLNWAFTVAPQWKAMAIGPVAEDGMRYWRNGSEMSKSGPHVEPVDYFFHGTRPGVFVGDDIDYQDFFPFRANFGANTGTARVSIAGSVILRP